MRLSTLKVALLDTPEVGSVTIGSGTVPAMRESFWLIVRAWQDMELMIGGAA
jgi:hypothetical protein